jgi:hypothetical protein
MTSSKEPVKFEFVVSTLSHNASTQKIVQRFIRKHVMRPFKRRKTPPKTVILHDNTLAEYLAQRQRQRKVVIGKQVLLLTGITDLRGEGTFSAGLPFSAAVLLGASRPNPFGKYLIDMDMRDHELIYHSKTTATEMLTLLSRYVTEQLLFRPFD